MSRRVFLGQIAKGTAVLATAATSAGEIPAGERVRDNRMQLLLLSNSTIGGVFLAFAADWIKGHFQASPEHRKTILFVPYALKDQDAYAHKVATALRPMGIDVVSAHTSSDPVALLNGVDGVFVGGGNTFRLLDKLQETGLLAAIRDKVKAGLPYMGASAGINVVCLTIKTTNDMPIRQPRTGLDAMGLLPFQINPHYVEGDFYHKVRGKLLLLNGETRDQRIQEFHEENATPVLGIREGSALRISGNRIELLGGQAARLFERGKSPVDVDNLNSLAALHARQAERAPLGRP